jgi:hypothetical protein
METESDSLVEESILLYIVLVLVMPWARWLVSTLSLYRPGFCHMPVCVRFVLEEVVLGQLVSRYFSFPVIVLQIEKLSFCRDDEDKWARPEDLQTKWC